MKLPKTLNYNDFINLVDRMFNSNKNLFVGTNLWMIDSLNSYIRFDEVYMYEKPDITIISIKVSIPSFSIGDTVMIVDTGEIGEIKYQHKENWQFEIIWDWRERYSFSENLVKIPTDLLPILQD